ncbi:L-gulonolactone oxidase-like [Branchiostoma floridae]|uniref:L-gulonolactone oxidase n=1 Tax=Branchiostoma floridae TaxID=7739 RepID=C3ZI45_BRAFL|nr:L-gulonolactone oxidase-like [Branchiostoma floridae]|eukprot:XP_002591776.1 hypothetical protein BRAFLDRAFT_123525 [Branchiostoma floridae]
MAGDAPVVMTGQTGRTFTNWAKTFSCEPELFFEPTTTEEIRQILDKAKRDSKHVKVCGFGHSPSDIACTTDYMISLAKFKQVLEVDKENCVVTVQSGILLKELNEEVLPKYNMALSNQGAVSEISAAGVISTGTHGTGKTFGIFATKVLEMTMMTASGEVLRLSREENKEVFLTALVGLGSLGIILTVKIQCEPAFNLHQVQFSCSLDKILSNLDKHLDENEHFKFMWYPYTDGVVAFLSNRTKKPVQTNPSWFWDYFVGYYVLEFLLWMSTFCPALLPCINKFYYKLYYAVPSEQVDRSDKVFNFECLFKQYVTEWSFPRSETANVLLTLQEWVKSHPEHKVHFPVEVRFVQSDDIYLSPCYQQDNCYINIISYRPYGKDAPKDAWWDMYESVMHKVGGKPHWAKAHKVTPDQFQKLYPMFSKFCTVRKQLDPQGMFLNPYLERHILGMTPQMKFDMKSHL